VARLQADKCCDTKVNGLVVVEEILRKHQGKDGALIDVLHDTQASYGYLPEAAMTQIAEGLALPLSKVYGVATFYSLFTLAPKGEHIIRICESAPCHIRGAIEVLQAIQEQLGIKPGETTEDGKFSLEFTSCLGVCGVAPAIMIGERVYGNLSPEKVKEVLNNY
jgi:NADH-quinone oxidoreductase E subunit